MDMPLVAAGDVAGLEPETFRRLALGALGKVASLRGDIPLRSFSLVGEPPDIELDVAGEDAGLGADGGAAGSMRTHNLRLVLDLMVHYCRSRLQLCVRRDSYRIDVLDTKDIERRDAGAAPTEAEVRRLIRGCSVVSPTRLLERRAGGRFEFVLFLGERRVEIGPPPSWRDGPFWGP